MNARAVSISLGLLLIVAAAAALPSAPGRTGAVLGPVVPDTAEPRILSYDVTPRTLKTNRVNFVRLSFRFHDGNRDLRGGLLTVNFGYQSASGEPLSLSAPRPALSSCLPVRDLRIAPAGDGGRPPFVTYPLTEEVFKQEEGNFELWFGVLAEGFDKLIISFWLRDNGGLNGADMPKVALVRSTAPSGPKQGRRVGQLAYDFTLLDKAGNRKTLSTYRGKVVLVDFSTMWCGPCRVEAGDLQQLYLKYRKQGFIILSVLTENYATDPIRPSDCKTWATTYGLTFPVLADLFWGVFDPYHAFPDPRRIPDNYLIDKAGKIRWKKLGYTATIKAQLESKIQQLLAE